MSAASSSSAPAATTHSVEALFTTSVRTPAVELLAVSHHDNTAPLPQLPDHLLQEIGSALDPASFRAANMVCRSLRNALAYTAPGLKAARTDGEVSLYPWQAANVHLLVSFLQHKFSKHVAGKKGELPPTEGMVLCDAPGGGKTVSVLSTVVKTIPSTHQTHAPPRTCVMFAPKVIVPQWASQLTRHFDPSVSGLHLYCASDELHLYDPDAMTPLDARPSDAIGGVYVEGRSTAKLPPTSVLATFDIVVFAKEMLSLKTDSRFGGSSSASSKEKNDEDIKRLRPFTRLVVIDESHNLSASGQISNQQLNVEGFSGVPKLLMSGTPGTAPRRLYDMLALIRHESWRNGGGFSAWLKARFARGTHDVLPEVERSVLLELNSCFLHTPPEVIFASREAQRSTKKIEPSEAEAISYNYVLSLHQRDVLRAGAGKTRPSEWTKDRKQSNLDWQVRGGEGSSAPPSADKTVLELLCAANGGELWAVDVKKHRGKGKKLSTDEYPAYLNTLLDPTSEELPQCSSCGIAVPGVLSLPCGGCDWQLCAECFRKDLGFSCFATKCDECGQKRKTFTQWVRLQPWLEIKSAADKEFEIAQTISTAVQVQMHHQNHNAAGSGATLLKQPAKRPFEALTVAHKESLASMADDDLMQRTEAYAKVGELAMFLKKLKYPLGERGPPSEAKVLIVPPHHKDVRETFIGSLRAAIGRDAVSDLNDKGSGASGGKGKAGSGARAETAVALNKFRLGRGGYWQCSHCGELYEAATTACSTSTFKIKVENAVVGGGAAGGGGGGGGGAAAAAGAAAEASEPLRFIKDVEKVDSAGRRLENQTIFIGDRVAVCQPGLERRRTHDPCGKVVSKGSCNGKRPTSRESLIPAPEGSCFVLILNASGIEGLDLGEATHLIKTEPIAREDKELQAEARGRRLGDGGTLQIVQLLMADTIEEAMDEANAEARAKTSTAIAMAAEAGGAAEAEGSASKAGSSSKSETKGSSPPKTLVRKGKKGKKRAREPSTADKKDGEEDEEQQDAEDGRQAALLNSLKLLRHEEEEDEEDVMGAEF